MKYICKIRKKEYLSPETEIFGIDSKCTILTGSNNDSVGGEPVGEIEED